MGRHDKTLLSVCDLAKFCGVAEATVWKWQANDIGPQHIVVDDELRFRLADVEAWLERHDERTQRKG